RNDHVGGKEIKLVRSVSLATAVANIADVGLAQLASSGFHLDAEKVSLVLDGKIVMGGVAPGLCNAQAELGCAGHKAQLGPFSAHFMILDVSATAGHFNCLNVSAIKMRP